MCWYPSRHLLHICSLAISILPASDCQGTIPSVCVYVPYPPPHPPPLQIVKEYERAVILRLGKMTSRKAKGPGLFFILPCIDNVFVIDLRTITFDIPPQKVLSL